ncbi:MAG: hypothetical protein WED04_07830 [Promethearchaeati archaeon SRVP18_Atabeyarchaeia-1]
MRAEGKHQDSKQAELMELRDAIRKLVGLTRKMRNMAMKRRSPDPTLVTRGSGEEDVESKVRHFTEALLNYLRLRRELRSSFVAFQNSLANLERAETVEEVSTLMGLTVAAAQEEYRRIQDQIIEQYEKTLFPAMPEIESVIKAAGETKNFSKWMRDISGQDANSGEDDYTRMVAAIRDRNVTKFNEIYEKVKKRIETEERR